MITYRDALPADGPELDSFARAIWVETFGHASSAEDSAAYLATAYGPTGALLADLASGRTRFHLALRDGAVVGYARLGQPWLPDAEPDAMQLSQIYVASNLHGAGVGHALLDWSIDTSRGAGAMALLLTVWEHNDRAYRFYLKRGFTYVGDYAFPVGEQIDTDHILRLAL